MEEKVNRLGGKIKMNSSESKIAETSNQTAEKEVITDTEWEQYLEDQKTSGLSVKNWCREHGISSGSFYRYQRKSRENRKEDRELVPLAMPLSVQKIQGITISSERSGIRIDLPDHADPAQLTAIIEALKSC